MAQSISYQAIGTPSFQFDLRINDIQRANSRILALGAASEGEIVANMAKIQAVVDDMLERHDEAVDIDKYDWSGVFAALEVGEAWCASQRCDPRKGVGAWPVAAA
jgi:hypothetical protein